MSGRITDYTPAALVDEIMKEVAQELDSKHSPPAAPIIAGSSQSPAHAAPKPAWTATLQSPPGTWSAASNPALVNLPGTDRAFDRFANRLIGMKNGFQPQHHARLMKYLLRAIDQRDAAQLGTVLALFERVLAADDMTPDDKRHILFLLGKQGRHSATVQAFVDAKSAGTPPPAGGALAGQPFDGTYGFELEYVAPQPLGTPADMVDLIKKLHDIGKRKGYDQPAFEPDSTLSSGWREYSHEFVTQILKADDDVAMAMEVMQTLKLFGAHRTRLTGDHMHVGGKQDAIAKFRAAHPDITADDGTIQKRYLQSFMIAFTHAIPEWHAVSRGESKFHRFNWRPLGHKIAGMLPYASRLYDLKDDAKNRARFIRRLNRKFDKDFDRILQRNSGNVVSKIQLLRYSLFNLGNLPELGGKSKTVQKWTLEIRGLEHWLWKKMTVEPDLLAAYVGYVNRLSGIAIGMARQKIDTPATDLAALVIDPASAPNAEIAAAARQLQHDVSLATFKAGLTDARAGDRDNTRYALYVLNHCFRHNPNIIAGRTAGADAQPYPLLTGVTSEDVHRLVESIGSVPMVLQRLGALNADLKAELTAKVDAAIVDADNLPPPTRDDLRQWRIALGGEHDG